VSPASGIVATGIDMFGTGWVRDGIIARFVSVAGRPDGRETIKEEGPCCVRAWIAYGDAPPCGGAGSSK